MAIPREKKEMIVKKLQEVAKNAKTVVFVQFDKVTAEEANALRNACAETGVDYTVAKKTLIKKSFEDVPIEGEFPVLEGEIALAYSDDVLDSARVMGEQNKALDDRLRIIGGVFEGSFIPAEKMQAIAEIPPIETLYAQFLTVIQAPIRNLVSVFGQIADTKSNN